jgi:glycosyltransferase involved in cell wall biosynthesis
MALTRFRSDSGNIPKVLRVDGVHLVRSKEGLWRNKIVSESLKMADVVVWQSEFCKRVAGGVLKYRPERQYVIHNAAPVVPSDEQYEAYTSLHGPADKIVALCAKWDYADGRARTHKRLYAQAELAAWYAGFNPTVEFRVYGKTYQRPYECDRVRYYGHLPEAELKRHLCAADVLLYLPYYDWMPNSVVEAIACGLPVIASNNGGQAEVADVVVQTDTELPAEMMAKERVPGLVFPDIGKALDGVHRSTASGRQTETIQDVARKYKLALEAAIDARS